MWNQLQFYHFYGVPKQDIPLQTIEALSKLLHDERLKRQISKNELSQRSGISRAAIRTIENGEKQPNIYSLLKICEGLEIELWELLRRAGENS